MATLPSPTIPATVLGKRKASSRQESPLVLHLQSPEPSTSFHVPTTSGRTPSSQRPYACLFEGCEKAYKKPSRLAEHERSHTGVRPYICAECTKSYLRETHLQAHARSHQPESARPFVCPKADCSKRFWTTQHLRAHSETHAGEKPFKCPEDGCTEAFAKHHQLHTHACTAHSPPGTKPYACQHAGCPKSFSTNQKLAAHAKVHEEKRYTCVHAACLPKDGAATPTYFPTWTALQNHVRIAHPPTCPHASCNGRTFTQQKGLRAHLKLHEQHEAEAAIERALNSSDEHNGRADREEPERPRKRRRGGEVGRDWKCDVPGCEKDFKSKKALTTHKNVSHLGRRDHVCPREDCRRAFGYKHLLHRHMTKLHSKDGEDEAPQGITDDEETADENDESENGALSSAIDDLTGQAYNLRLRSTKVECPYPNLGAMVSPGAASASSSTHQKACTFVFTRAYDLRRHLEAEHHVNVGKEQVELWVKNRKPSSRV